MKGDNGFNFWHNADIGSDKFLVCAAAEDEWGQEDHERVVVVMDQFFESEDKHGETVEDWYRVQWGPRDGLRFSADNLVGDWDFAPWILV